MYEKVNPKHPDKVADRIAGAIVDECYKLNDNPKAAVEVLIGHDKCLIINETSEHIPTKKVEDIVKRIAEIKDGQELEIIYKEVKQDKHLSDNQRKEIRCGDNGIFKGVPDTEEQKELTQIAKDIYEKYNSDGKYIIDDKKVIICQSKEDEPIDLTCRDRKVIVNPIGYWTGGINVDSGATNRKLGSDMGDSVTGGGLHGKDLSKADVSVNIYCYLMAQKLKKTITCNCAIGDTTLLIRADDGTLLIIDYTSVVEQARRYITELGGFEKFAEWGLIR